jgi:hypothetical protein
MALKASNYDAIPLCAQHHQTGGFCAAIHDGQKTWEKKCGYQRDFLERLGLTNAEDSEKSKGAAELHRHKLDH